MSVCINRESEQNTVGVFASRQELHSAKVIPNTVGCIDAVDFQYSLARNMILFRFLSCGIPALKELIIFYQLCVFIKGTRYF